MSDTILARIFPGKISAKSPAFKNLFIDQYGDYAWCVFHGTEFAKPDELELVSILQKQGLKAAVLLLRKKEGSFSAPKTVFGIIPKGDFTVTENGLKYLIKFAETAHPGLFLDHAPLRKWLLQNSKGKRVLNLFSYTGSLSVAAASGGATQVVSVDLSKNYQNWAKKNFELNSMDISKHDFWVGDTFEYLKRLQKKGEEFDLIVSDPPSFSRADGKVFSTSKDLVKLHRAILPLLKLSGVLVTSINSENVSEKNFHTQIVQASIFEKMKLKELQTVEAHPSFPKTHPLKGFILKRTE